MTDQLIRKRQNILKRIRDNRKKFFIFSLSIFFVLASFATYFTLNPKSIKASWWDDNWNYRKPVDVNSTNGSAQSDVYISFDNTDVIDTSTLISEGKMQSDCGDLRFATEGGMVLPYYIVSGCNTTSTDVNVFFESFPDGEQIIYFYYGNSGAPNGTESSDFSTEASNYTIGTPGGTEEVGPGPIAYWKFDEGADNTCNGGEDACDQTANANDGTFGASTAAPTWQAEDLCIDGKCLLFDGGNDTITVANTATVQTVSFWIKVMSTSTTEQILDLNGTDSLTSTSGTVTASGFGTETIYVDGVSGATTLTANRWHHVAVTTASSLSASAITMGNISTNYGNMFLDEVKMYPYARSAAEIKVDYNNGAAALGIKDKSWLSDGLVGYWKMDENSGNAADSSGNGLTLTNNSTTTFVGGKFGNGSEHVPASSQYFSTATTINGVKSVSFWTNPDSNTNYFISLTSSAYITSSSGAISATGFTDPNIYVDGVSTTTLSANSWQLVTVTTDTAINADQFYVGREGSNYYDGTMDEVRLYNRAFTPSEIRRLVNWAPGPVGYWPMDEGSWTNDCSTDTVFDRSGNGNNGDACPNSTGPTGGAIGKFGKAGDFDGSEDYVVSNSNFNFYNQDITITAWIKSNSASSRQIIASQDPSTPDSRVFYFQLNSSGQVAFLPYSAAGGGTEVATSGSITAGKWHFVAARLKNGTAKKVWLDSTAAESTSGELTLEDNAQTLQIGSRARQDSTFFNGQIDDLRIYNYARTPAQIIEDMNAGHPAPGSPVGSAVGHWKFDEGYGTTAYDSNISTGGAEDLTLSTATSSWSNSGKFGKAFSAGGARWLTRTDDSDLDFTASEDMTISLWMDSTIASGGNPSATEYIINKPPSGATNGGYAIYANTSGQICFGIDDDNTSFPEDSVCTSTDVYDNAWHNIVAVKTGTSRLDMYVDGVVDGTPDTSISSTTNTLENSSTFFVASEDAVDDTDDYNGELDEMQIFRSALTASQVAQLYNQGFAATFGTTSSNTSGTGSNDALSAYCPPGSTDSCVGPVGEWKFDENTGTSTVYDTSGNANDGTMNGSMAESDWVQGKFGSSLDLDGSNDYIRVSDDDAFTPSALSVSAWVKLDTTGDNRVIVSKWDYSSNTEWLLTRRSNDDFHFEVKDNNSFNSLYVQSDTVPSAGVWYHVMGTWNGGLDASDVKFYVNGIQEGTGIESGTFPGLTNTNQDVIIGNQYSSGAINSSRYLDGIIDEVRFYNYARTPAQIAWEYNRGKPVGWWKFDECQGTTAYDASGNGNNGTITPGASTHTSVGTCNSGSASQMWDDGGTGKRNFSLDFDGGDDYVDMNDIAALDFNDADFSIAGWFNRETFTTDDTIIAKKNDQLNTSAGYVVWIDDSTDDLRLFVSDGDSTNDHTVDSTSSFTSTGWNHFVIVYDDSSATGSKIYINGLDDNAGNNTTGTFASINDISNAIDFRIGSESDGGEPFPGELDDIRIYNYALTEQQVRNVMNEGSAVRFGP